MINAHNILHIMQNKNTDLYIKKTSENAKTIKYISIFKQLQTQKLFCI